MPCRGNETRVSIAARAARAWAVPRPGDFLHGGQHAQRRRASNRCVTRGHAGATQEALIRQLNPLIRGWAMYHRHVVAKATFSLIDSHIWQLLRKWAVRRHPTKGARWMRRRYFQTDGQRSWDFATDEIRADGSIGSLRLFRAIGNVCDSQTSFHFLEDCFLGVLDLTSSTGATTSSARR
jgi:hypothetical protein